MSSAYGVVYPLWSFHGDTDNRLARLIGEVGVDHITVPVVTGPVVDFRAAPTAGPHHFETQGGWHFQPEREHYHTNEVKPKSADWLRTRNPLPQLVELARKRDLQVHFRVDLPAAFLSAPGHETCAVRNMWDEQVPIAGPCTLHPDYRAMFRGTVEDLLTYAPDGFEFFVDKVVDDRWSRARPARPQTDLDASCFDLCFCATCREVAIAADIDVESVAESARAESLRELQAIQQDASRDLARIRVFQSARAAHTRKWLQTVRETLEERNALIIRRSHASANKQVEFPTWETLVLADRESRRATDSPLEREFAGIAALSVSAWRPTFLAADKLVRFVNSAHAAGTRFFDFERMDAAPEEVVDWLKQAVRFARRGDVE